MVKNENAGSQSAMGSTHAELAAAAPVLRPDGPPLSAPLEAQRNALELVARAKRRRQKSLDEYSAKQVLGAYGIEVPRSARIQGLDDIDNALEHLKPPLALKIISPDVVHKSDSGGVKVSIQGASELRNALRAMTDQMRMHQVQIDGFLVEEMAPPGCEIVIGGLRDPSFGPVVMFGIGGIFVEVLRDVSFRICPITRPDAEEMLSEIRGAPLLDGARGSVAVNKAKVADALMAIGGEHGLLVSLKDSFTELDINPLIASEEHVLAVDARLILQGA